MTDRDIEKLYKEEAERTAPDMDKLWSRISEAADRSDAQEQAAKRPQLSRRRSVLRAAAVAAVLAITVSAGVLIFGREKASKIKTSESSSVTAVSENKTAGAVKTISVIPKETEQEQVPDAEGSNAAPSEQYDKKNEETNSRTDHYTEKAKNDTPSEEITADGFDGTPRPELTTDISGYKGSIMFVRVIRSGNSVRGFFADTDGRIYRYELEYSRTDKFFEDLEKTAAEGSPETELSAGELAKVKELFRDLKDADGYEIINESTAEVSGSVTDYVFAEKTVILSAQNGKGKLRLKGGEAAKLEDIFEDKAELLQ